MRRVYSILLAIIIGCMSMVAQTVVSGSVVNKSDEALTGAVVLFANSDSIVGGTTTDSKGRFQLKNLPAGEYECRVSILGYKPAKYKFTLAEKKKLPQFVLDEDAKALAEVTVVGDTRKMTKELAGMSIYYLSDRAKKEMDAYRALQEIPRLIVDPGNQTIALDNGTAPLILVNGVKKPLTVILPELIESVEVIYNPPARYLGDASVASVLNIKLKKDGMKPYLRGNLNIRTTPNTHFLFSNGSFELGNATSSLYVTGGYIQDVKKRYNSYSDSYQGDIHRDLNERRNNSFSSVPTKIGGDKQLNPKDYLAFEIGYGTSPSSQKSGSEGNITDISTDESSTLTSIYESRTRSHRITGSLHYKHLFNDSRILEFTGNYSYSQSRSNAYREQNSEIYNFISNINLHNRGHLGKLDINYSDMLSKSIQLQAGSNTQHSVTNIDDILDSWPNYRYRNTREYLYAGIDNNMSGSKFNYVVSLGLDMVFSDASGARHSYIDLIPSISLNYNFARRQNISLFYRRSRSIPSPGDLNPRNTSTDSLFLNIGNPKLTPSHLDYVKLDYAYNFGNIRLNPFVQYSHNSDLIVPYGYLDGSIYVNSFRNFGHTGQLMTGVILSYNIPQGKPYYGGVNIEAHYQKDYIKGMSFSGESFGGYIGLYGGYNKISGSVYLGYYSDYIYTIYSKSRGEPSTNIHVNWSVSKSLSLSFSAEKYLCPNRYSKTWTINGDYHAYNSVVERTNSPRFCIGVMYNFVTRNFKWRSKKQFNGVEDNLGSVRPNDDYDQK